MKLNVVNSINYEGLLIASDWDEDGNIIGLSLSSTKELEYPIYMDGKAQYLSQFCKERVRIKGKLNDGVLQITTFKILKRFTKRIPA